jgi:trans-aconitate methyltransferase
MHALKSPQLSDKDVAIAFYEERYSRGYMVDWPIEKKKRIREIIEALDLPSQGKALDFGCGNGVLTEVIRQALPPAWRVYGADVSRTAIANATRQYSNCSFGVLGDHQLRGKKFDLLVSHHVLEHVSDLRQSLAEINSHLNDHSTILHILPCGNHDSFEHRICLLRRDGIDSEQEGRFFFEDEGHVRRLTTEQLKNLYGSHGFVLERDYYSNQRDGAINWITQSRPSFILMLTESTSAIDDAAICQLRTLRHRLLLLWCLRFPASFVDRTLKKQHKTARDYVGLVIGTILYLFSKPVDAYLKYKASDEWNKYHAARNGSEMYIVFRKSWATTSIVKSSQEPGK